RVSDFGFCSTTTLAILPLVSFDAFAFARAIASRSGLDLGFALFGFALLAVLAFAFALGFRDDDAPRVLPLRTLLALLAIRYLLQRGVSRRPRMYRTASLAATSSA